MKNQKSKNKEYVKNTIILMFGKFATQFMSFLLIPLYTHYLDTSDYGSVDLIQTYLSLLIPLLILRLDSAIFRFLIDERKKDDDDNKKRIITNVFLVLFIILVIFLVIYVAIASIFSFKYVWLIFVNVIAIMFSNILLQISRGLGNNKDYSIACVITATGTLVINCVLILCFGYNAGSILIATSIANIFCSIYIFFKLGVYKYISLKKYDRKLLKEMLKYSIPMIPNALSWWIVNVSDRTIISYVWGTAFNGIYTISSKFSNMIGSIFSIFNMSWQESASLHINDDDRDTFFSEMISNILILFTCITAIMIALLPFLYNVVVGEKYSDSYVYIPILLIANLFHIFIQLLGGIYIAKKETKKVMMTTIISAFINIVINLMFIKKYCLYAASISTLIAYVSMAVFRFFDVKKYVNLKIYFDKLLISIGFLSLTVFAYYLKNSIVVAICLVITLFLSLYINMDIIKLVLYKTKNKFFNLAKLNRT